MTFRLKRLPKGRSDTLVVDLVRITKKQFSVNERLLSMITLNAVTKRYGALAAVNNVSYNVKKGEYFALLGPNGAGKTTIVRMLLGFSPPGSGALLVWSFSRREI